MRRQCEMQFLTSHLSASTIPYDHELPPNFSHKINGLGSKKSTRCDLMEVAVTRQRATEVRGALSGLCGIRIPDAVHTAVLLNILYS
jgi:hypothetical protein